MDWLTSQPYKTLWWEVVSDVVVETNPLAPGAPGACLRPEPRSQALPASRSAQGLASMSGRPPASPGDVHAPRS